MNRTAVGLFLFLPGARMAADISTPVAPIITEVELRQAAADVPVEKIDFVLPATEQAARASLSRRFFNQPGEKRYAGLTNENWSLQWQLFTDELVAKADKLGFDGQSLASCLITLQRGQNRPTIRWQTGEPELFLPGKLQADLELFEEWTGEKWQQEQKNRKEHPEQWSGSGLVVVPVGAYLARYAQGECWIIVCKWEQRVQGGPLRMGHVRVWALDTKTAKILAFVTCM